MQSWHGHARDMDKNTMRLATYAECFQRLAECQALAEDKQVIAMAILAKF